jgi:uncharacterized membrane protein SpoIIM required for sporulation
VVTIPSDDAADEMTDLHDQLASEVLSAMAMLNNPFEWFVPGAVLGVPAILILVVLGLQLVAGLLSARAVRRMTEEDRPARRPLRPTWLPSPGS